MGSTIVAFYTSPATVRSISELCGEIMPDVRLVNLVDEGMIQDVIAANGVPQRVERRLLRYYMACEDMGADVILNTCSSIGEASETAARYIAVPILNIDRAMACAAVKAASRVAVLATLPTTLGPTVRLIEATARRRGKEVTVVNGLARGAFEALGGGDAERHDAILLETARRLAPSVDAVVLAQGSMARMEARIRDTTGTPIFSSPRSGVEAVRSFLQGDDA